MEHQESLTPGYLQSVNETFERAKNSISSGDIGQDSSVSLPYDFGKIERIEPCRNDLIAAMTTATGVVFFDFDGNVLDQKF